MGLISFYHLCLILTFLEFSEFSHYRNHLPTQTRRGYPLKTVKDFGLHLRPGMADILDGSIRPLLRPLVRVTLTPDSISYRGAGLPGLVPSSGAEPGSPKTCRTRSSGPECRTVDEPEAVTLTLRLPPPPASVSFPSHCRCGPGCRLAGEGGSWQRAPYRLRGIAITSTPRTCLLRAWPAVGESPMQT